MQRFIAIVVAMSVLGVGAKGQIVATKSAKIVMIDTTGNEVNLLPKKGEEGQSPKWAPNGKAIGYSGDFGVIMQMDPDGKNKRQVTQSNAWAHIDWSPDGTKIVATKATGEDIINEIWAIDIASGEEVLLTKEGDLNWYPDWSPDGTRIAFGSYRNGTFQVYTLTIATKRIRQLTNQGSNGGPVWSPDGTKIALLHRGEHEGDLWVLSAEGGKPIQITQTPDEVEKHAKWSPDGKMIAFNLRASDREMLQMILAEGGTAKTLLTTPKGQSVPFGWSPDSKQVVASCNGTITGFPVTGGSARRVDTPRWPRCRRNTSASLAPS